GHNIQSAGSIPSGEVHPNAVIAMDEVGIDIRDQFSKSTDDLDKDFIDNLDFAITLCAEEVCPVLPTKAKSLHWMNEDPANTAFNNKQLISSFAITRDNIFKLLKKFIIDNT
ncbi:MAG: arsenate reductase ArsC, partial [Gammaproteobacteria bacterium]